MLKKKPKSKLKMYRENNLISKAELARKANLSPLTINRIEDGSPCRIDTKRKIIQALGLRIEDKDLVFDPVTEEG
jgi:DNA-binding XRE family transcriptional regulator